MFELMWELRQQRNITDVGIGARAAEHRANTVDGRVDALESLVQRLSLVCQAMWEVTREKTGMSDEALKARLREIDLRDGVVDGKAAKGAETCPACQRPISIQHKKCLYCGFQKPAEAVGPFEL